MGANITARSDWDRFKNNTQSKPTSRHRELRLIAIYIFSIVILATSVTGLTEECKALIINKEIHIHTCGKPFL